MTLATITLDHPTGSARNGRGRPAAGTVPVAVPAGLGPATLRVLEVARELVAQGIYPSAIRVAREVGRSPTRVGHQIRKLRDLGIYPAPAWSLGGGPLGLRLATGRKGDGAPRDDDGDLTPAVEVLVGRDGRAMDRTFTDRLIRARAIIERVREGQRRVERRREVEPSGLAERCRWWHRRWAKIRRAQMDRFGEESKMPLFQGVFG